MNLKTIEICEKIGESGSLKMYYEKNGIKDYNIYFPLEMNLSLGELSTLDSNYHRIEFFKKLYPVDKDYIHFDNPEEFFNCIDTLNKISNNINDDTKIRIWSSKEDDDDYMMLLFLCNFLKDKTDKISVIFTSDYSEYAWDLISIDIKDIEYLFKYEKLLSKDEIQSYANQWNDLVKINSEVRTLENGEVKCKKYSDYYDDILNIIKAKLPCKRAEIIATCMLNRAMKNAGDVVYNFMIEQLLDSNKLKIVQKDENSFKDIIDINK